jgi:hypothetical protein
MATCTDRWTLRELPLAPRLVLAAFLATTAIGYLSSLISLHFAQAAPGGALPGFAEAERVYFGSGNGAVSQVERLLEATGGPLNGSGSMRPAFTTASERWESVVHGKTPEQLLKLHEEREGERLALLSWLRAGARQEAYELDDHPLAAGLAQLELTEAFLVKDAHTGRPVTPRRVHVQSLLRTRCASCHSEEGRHELARLVPLDTYERLKPHCETQTVRPPALRELARSTHAHLLGLAVLYGLTGLLFTFTAYPGWVRALVGPLPILAQLVNVACWWLGRIDPFFTQVVVVSGVLAAVGLALQVLGGLWDLFSRTGRVILALLLLAGCVAGGAVKVCVLDPYLEQEQMTGAGR